SASIIALASAHLDARAHFEASADAERRPNGKGGCSPDDDSPAADVSLTSTEPFQTRTRLDRRPKVRQQASLQGAGLWHGCCSLSVWLASHGTGAGLRVKAR